MREKTKRMKTLQADSPRTICDPNVEKIKKIKSPDAKTQTQDCKWLFLPKWLTGLQIEGLTLSNNTMSNVCMQNKMASDTQMADFSSKPLLDAASPCITKHRAVSAFSTLSQSMFPVRVGHHWDSPLWLLQTESQDRRLQSVQFGYLRIAFELFCRDAQRSLQQSVKMARMRVRTSKSQAGALCWTIVDFHLRVWR